MILAITFGDESFAESARLNLWTALHIGKVDRVRQYTPQDIDKA